MWRVAIVSDINHQFSSQAFETQLIAFRPGMRCSERPTFATMVSARPVAAFASLSDAGRPGTKRVMDRASTKAKQPAGFTRWAARVP